MWILFILENTLFFIELSTNPPEGIVAGPVSEENFFEWEALITYVSLTYVSDPQYFLKPISLILYSRGPEGTCFEGGVSVSYTHLTLPTIYSV